MIQNNVRSASIPNSDKSQNVFPAFTACFWPFSDSMTFCQRPASTFTLDQFQPVGCAWQAKVRQASKQVAFIIDPLLNDFIFNG